MGHYETAYRRSQKKKGYKMNTITIAGVDINKVSISQLLFNKTMLFAYALLAFGLFGIYEVINERYLLLTANTLDAGLNPGSQEVANAFREAIFGAGGEVKRESPWTLYIVNYIYMIYTGSGIIFIVTIAELLDIKLLKKTAAGFLTFGLCMVFGGLFTIFFDLNVLNMHWMFLTPNITSGMWLMLPLYVVYISFVLFEIYLLISKNKQWTKKFALAILVVGILIDVAEYYIQAKLFNMNTARHLWTTYPILPLYFIISSFLGATGVMIVYSYTTYKETLKAHFDELMSMLKKITLFMIVTLGAYEAVSFLFIDKKWANVILFSGFDFEFYIYAMSAIVIPFGLLIYRFFQKTISDTLILTSAVFVIAGTYIGRFIFVYGGNAYPMSDRFGKGFERYTEYETTKEFIFFYPHMPEIFIVIGSVGVVFAMYKMIDVVFSVSKLSEH
jgi:hypothetical protein